MFSIVIQVLWGLPTTKVDSLLESSGLKQFTVNSIVDLDLYRESLVQVRKESYTLNFEEEFLEGVWAFSA
ncbi:MAG: IclR family transcriptional regulator C-terminal domain-containing protein, partial [SAR324 cluster bacterium]|nr:IclR family transcriptional regulator C-terminal domain-containing protein [SAR324 cluster bacterium]